jgi:hypothetical protein
MRRSRSGPLYARKQTYAAQQQMSALGQKRPHALQQKESSSDQLVGAGEQRRRSSLARPKHDWLHGRDIRLPDLREEEEIAQCEHAKARHLHGAF